VLRCVIVRIVHFPVSLITSKFKFTRCRTKVMKNTFRIFVLTMAIFFAGNHVPAQTIIKSAHDFSKRNWNIEGEVCVVCHADKNSGYDYDEFPLWNHQMSIESYTVYSSATLNASVGQPDGVSKLCLSCHDGTVALDNYGGRKDGNVFISDNANLGTDLSDDHPISFVYDSYLSLEDGGLYDPATTKSGLGDTIEKDMLHNQKLQCTSCHDVHNAMGVQAMLIKSNNVSGLCLTCHRK